MFKPERKSQKIFSNIRNQKEEARKYFQIFETRKKKLENIFKYLKPGRRARKY